MIALNKIKCRNAAFLYLAVPTLLFLFTFIKPWFGLPAVFGTEVVICRILKGNTHSDLKLNHPALQSNQSRSEGSPWNERDIINVKKSVLIISSAAILLWCYFGGQGGLFYQSDDWFARNAIYRDLITHDWPVYYEVTDTILTYYIGHWLLPAFIGKCVYFITGNMELTWQFANIFLWIWTAAGIYITLILLWCYADSKSRKTQICSFAVLVLFSGLDIIGILISDIGTYYIHFKKHIEWWAQSMQFSSNTTCLFWVFNQAIPAWIATMVMMLEFENRRSIRYMGFVILTTLICSPLPCVGLCVYCFGYALNNVIVNLVNRDCTGLRSELKNIFSLENLLSTVSILPFTGPYFLSNASFQGTKQAGTVEESSVLPLITLLATLIFAICILAYFLPRMKDEREDIQIRDVKHGKHAELCYWVIIFVILYNLIVKGSQLASEYFMFLMLEIGVYVIALYRENRENVVYYLTVLLAGICPLIRVGYAYDFCMRASIPAIIVTMALCVKYLNRHMILQIDGNKENKDKKSLICSIAIVVCLLIGSVTPVIEFYRGISEVIKAKQIALVNDDYKTLDQFTESGGVNENFVSTNYSDSLFFKYLARS